MKNNKGILLIISGLLLIAAALFLTAYNLRGDYVAAQAVNSALVQLNQVVPAAETRDAEADSREETVIPDYILNPDMDMPVENIDGQDYIGILEIPALELELPIISEWSYSNLKIAPCRYAGSAYTDGLVIAAHNYQSHFAALSQLKEGDRVVFTDIDGNIFFYNVVAKEVLMETAVEEMTGGDFDLTLFTCTYDGNNRVTIRCDRVEN